MGSNRLATIDIGGTVYTYGYDAVGNMRSMPYLQGMDYDLEYQMVVCTKAW